ncbi:MAG: glycosyltransferase [Planctomycetota bacterium]|nr:glycosyltransferase [Planctomycetota bacterium]
MEKRTKILIFIVAYEAQTTLEKVLNRIPKEVFDYDTEILVIDDSSKDKTFEIGVKYSESKKYPITILYNDENQGYGGNQKLGYSYAIKNKFDIVVLLHGDGQYAPEYIPVLIKPLLDNSADVVMGSRMLAKGAALKGGMPLYKYIGNKILTKIQNFLLGTNFSEFHSGYRVYSVAALSKIPFRYNSNDFHFDTEIIIQLIIGNFRIKELSIPSYYGDEICRVNGIKYATNVIITTLLSRFHTITLFYDRKFDLHSNTNAFYDIKLGYNSSHTRALNEIAQGSHVLDIGCGPGNFAKELLKKDCKVVGMDMYKPENKNIFEDFYLWDESKDVFTHDISYYDFIVLLDVVEHFKKPEEFLENLRICAKTKHPKLIITTGNVAFFTIRFQLLLGRFNYGERGILDLTHTRLYTFKTLQKLLKQCGYKIVKTKGIPAPFPKAIGLNLFSKILLKTNELLIHILKGLFSFQIFMVATPISTVEAILDEYVNTSKLKAQKILKTKQVYHK